MATRSCMMSGLVWFVAVSLAFAERPPPIDDAFRVRDIGSRLRSENPILSQTPLAIFRIEESRTTPTIQYHLGRVLNPVKGFREGDLVVFSQGVPGEFVKAAIRLGHASREPEPEWVAGHEYLILVNRVRSWDPAARAVPREWAAFPVASAGGSETFRSDLHAIREILPQIQQFADIMYGPKTKRPKPLRELLLSQMDTGHRFMRWIVESEFAYNEDVYPGMSKPDAERIANFSEKTDFPHRARILEMLASRTNVPMDHWFLRAVSRGSRSPIHPGDTAAIVALDDTLDVVAKNLSIDSFWHILQRPTRSLNMWVRAFAQKRDPRLLPFIVRHLDPENLDPAATEALAHYRGDPAAEQAVVRAATEAKVRSDKRARAVARESLKRLGTPRALAVAEQLAGDDDNDSGPPGRDK